jgi:hypothetical protein
MLDARFPVQTLPEGNRRIRLERPGVFAQEVSSSLMRKKSKYYQHVDQMYSSCTRGCPLKRRWKGIAGFAGEASNRSTREKCQDYQWLAPIP